MAGCIHEVQLIGPAVLRGVFQTHCLRLDRDASLLLNVHIIKDLSGHFSIRKATAPLNQPVRQCRLAMVDVGDNRKITACIKVGHGSPIAASNRRSEEHTSELQSLMRISYADFCLTKKTHQELPQF